MHILFKTTKSIKGDNKLISNIYISLLESVGHNRCENWPPMFIFVIVQNIDIDAKYNKNNSLFKESRVNLLLALNYLKFTLKTPDIL